MNRMLLTKPLALAFPLLLVLATLCPMGLGGRASAQSDVCPSPLPTCAAPGSLGDFSGTFACTEVRTNSNGTVQVNLILATSDGKGNMTGKNAQNGNDPSNPTTYQDFSAFSGSITYCVNTDDTGYLTPSGSCPLAFIIDAAKTELRLMDSTEQRADVVVCRKQ